VALRLMGTSNIGLLSSASIFDQLDSWGDAFGVHAGKILFLLLAASAIGGVTVLALSSRAGLRWRVAGCNPTYARTLGIGVVASTMIGLGVTNALAALSGALLAVHQGFADVGLGQGVLIFALASMSLGDRLLSEQRLSVPIFVVVSSMVGSVVYQYLIALSVSAGLNPVDLKLITAVLVLMLVIVRARRHDDPFASV
jgi:putative ABC transport system permease protein